ncbi:MAG: NADH-quinone oxidoreductase subunit K [Candidatus Firestonebacteria bacterium]|nr:NADH-quinone oxidoreductase subunit K [Candidatus Firestonebacteria bacterium]
MITITTPPINFYYLGSVILIMIGFYIIVECPNLIKKIIGINIMETAVFLFLIAIAGAQGNKAPIVTNVNTDIYVNPFPQFMVIMGIMITLGVTTFGLGLIIRIYQHHHTIDARKLKKLIGQHNGEET